MLPPHLAHIYGLSHADGYRDYLIPCPDGGGIYGGRKHMYGEDKELWSNNCDASTLVEPTRKHFESAMQENFIRWGVVVRRLII